MIYLIKNYKMVIPLNSVSEDLITAYFHQCEKASIIDIGRYDVKKAMNRLYFISHMNIESLQTSSFNRYKWKDSAQMSNQWDTQYL